MTRAGMIRLLVSAVTYSPSRLALRSLWRCSAAGRAVHRARQQGLWPKRLPVCRRPLQNQPASAPSTAPRTISSKFDMSKIGTGEGAQAYGHGLYFAEKEGWRGYGIVDRAIQQAARTCDYAGEPYAEPHRRSLAIEHDRKSWIKGSGPREFPGGNAKWHRLPMRLKVDTRRLAHGCAARCTRSTSAPTRRTSSTGISRSASSRRKFKRDGSYGRAERSPITHW
jgi:hypothetical protein